MSKYYANRIDAERKLKLTLDSWLSTYDFVDRLDVEAKIINYVFDYANESLFVSLNGFAGCCAELVDLVTEDINIVKSEQHRQFIQRFKTIVDKIISICLVFLGFVSTRELAEFVNLHRGLMDINSVHFNTFIELQRAILLPSHQSILEIDKQIQVYLAIRQMKLRDLVQRCLDAKPPKLFNALDKESVNNMYRFMEENCEVFTRVLQFINDTYSKKRIIANEITDKKIAFSRQILKETQGVNPQLRKWIEEFSSKVLSVN